MDVARLRLLWVNFRTSGPDGISRVPFERFFSLTEIGPGELDAGELPDHWDAVCFNFDYPDMCGLRLIPEAKNRWPSAPILMLTMQSSAELALWALRSRVFDLLVKPPATGEVERMLKRVERAVRARNSQMVRKPQVAAVQLPAETRYRPQEPSATRLQA